MSKRLAILAEGTLGDLVPYIELARELRGRGHEVHFASHDEHRAIVEPVCDHFVSLHTNSASSVFKADAEAHRPLGPVSLLRRMLHVRRHFRPGAEYLAQIESLCRRVDLAAYHALVPYTADASEAAKITSVGVFHTPLLTTGEFARPIGPVGLHRRNWGTLVNRATHSLMERYSWWVGSVWLNERRTAHLGLEPRKRPGETKTAVAEIYLYSPILLAKPEDWPPHSEVVGFALPRQFREIPISPGNCQPPAVYLYFGSNHYTSAALLNTCVSAIRQCQAVPLVSDRTANLCPGDWIHRCELVPNDQFSTALGRSSAIMHHAGAGTCAIALRVGLPSICVPFFSEQRFWAARMERLGVAVRSHQFTEVTPGRLAVQIERALRQPGFRDRATAVAHRIGSENGAARAADILEEIVA